MSGSRITQGGRGGRPESDRTRSTGEGSDRGDMVMLDFMTAIVLFMALTGATVGAYLVAADSGAEGSRAPDLATIRIQDRLVNDLLVARTGDEALSPGCTDAFFAAKTGTAAAAECGFDRFDGSSEAAFLHSAFGLSTQYGVNVTLGSPMSTRRAIGPTPPAGTTLATSTRVVTFNGSVGPRTFYVLRVTVWRA